MKLKAKDSFHASGLGMIHVGTEFEAHDDLGRQLVEKGHATVVEGSTDTAAGAASTEKAAPKTLNKMDAPPANKTTVKAPKPAKLPEV